MDKHTHTHTYYILYYRTYKTHIIFNELLVDPKHIYSGEFDGIVKVYTKTTTTKLAQWLFIRQIMSLF
jgi:hypothetical protein